jgi:hypothetical protein
MSWLRRTQGAPKHKRAIALLRSQFVSSSQEELADEVVILLAHLQQLSVQRQQQLLSFRGVAFSEVYLYLSKVQGAV